jgi:polysaccharide export outer membrane protein
VPYPTYRLGSGDQLRVIVFGQDNLSRLYNVDSSGSVALPLIGPIRARASPPRSSPTTSPMS